MSFCSINFKRKNNTIEVLDKRGEKSSLYSKLLEYVNENNVYQGREWFFDKLVEQGKLKSTDNPELALGLYSIAYNSGKSEGYWINRIEELIPKPERNVNYELKAVNILTSDKAKQVFKKGEKNGWDLDKILTELQIPKSQKELILILGKTKLDDIITDLLSNYSYTVEINTAKEKSPYDLTDQTYNEHSYTFEYDGYEYEFDDYNLEETGGIGEHYKAPLNNLNNRERITKAEFDKAASNIGKNKVAEEKPTQYYSNLTVPGGANYTENEISTPLITPSIKGHAQFSTNNGIGWFRSDEKTTEYKGKEDITKTIVEINGFGYLDGVGNTDKGRYAKYKKDEYGEYTDYIDNITEKEYNDLLGVSRTNTRRILEVQSDLFQKGRDKEELVERDDKGDILFSTKFADYFIIGNNITIKHENGYKENFLLRDINGREDEQLIKEEIKKYKSNSDFNKKENQFLQLLNKDNNWVTFFIKSIIQDSAKKGYEKVLFPTGNTASKVEGHATLEEFKKQKEDRLKEIEKNKNEVDQNLSLFNDKKWRGFTKTEWYAEFEREINQLKQELKRVETEGFGALKPIYNFYENTVTNILKKQGYNPTLIKDEYGNTWNEVVLDDNFDSILLDKQSDRYTPSLLMYQDFIQKNQLYVGEEILPLVGESEYYRYLTEMMIKMNPEVKTQFSDNIKKTAFTEFTSNKLNPNNFINLMQTNMNTALGGYFPLINQNIVSEKATTKTLVHELVHATIQKEYEKKGEFYNKINDLFEFTDKYFYDNGMELPYGLSKPTEFLAESLSNPKFMEELNKIQYKEETVFTYLMTLISDFINKLLNVELNSNSVLAEVVNLTEQVLNNNQREIGKNRFVELSEIGQEVLDNWTTYFPDYAWMNKDQKYQMASLIEKGKLNLTCKF